jgi:hypothetical protein
MFTIKKRESYRWPVEHVIAISAGKPEKISFDAEFRALGQARISELLKLAAVMEIKDEAFLDEILAGWHDLKDGRNGEETPFPFSKQNLSELQELYPGITASFSRSWTESVLGGNAARKN